MFKVSFIGEITENLKIGVNRGGNAYNLIKLKVIRYKSGENSSCFFTGAFLDSNSVEEYRYLKISVGSKINARGDLKVIPEKIEGVSLNGKDVWQNKLVFQINKIELYNEKPKAYNKKEYEPDSSDIPF